MIRRMVGESSTTRIRVMARNPPAPTAFMKPARVKGPPDNSNVDTKRGSGAVKDYWDWLFSAAAEAQMGLGPTFWLARDHPI
jgi:hypothetical protein